MTTSTLSRQLSTAAVASVVAGTAVVVLGLAFAGTPGALGALVGAVVTVGVFAFGAVSVAVAAQIQPRAALAVALVTYLLQVVLLVAFFAGLQRSELLDDTLDRAWLAVAVVVVTLTWSALQIMAWQRGATPLASPVRTVVPGGER